MDELQGLWRLIDSRALDENDRVLRSPYGANPLGYIDFSNGRMLVALCNGDIAASASVAPCFNSFSGRYSFNGSSLEVLIDVASDVTRIGEHQIQKVIMLSNQQMLLRPQKRSYGSVLQRREHVWERVWPSNERMLIA